MRTVQYEPVVKKLAHYLINLEKECQFISNKETKSTLPKIMAAIRDQLTANRSCELTISKLANLFNHYNFFQLSIVTKILQNPLSMTFNS